MKVKRPSRAYRMGARAASAQQTHARIIEAALALVRTRDYDEVSLDEVASDAGVTVQTVLRRFGSKEGLAQAAAAAARERVHAQRWSSAPGDLAGAIETLVAHYAEWGAQSLHFLNQESRVPALRQITDDGRQLHAQWVEHAFAPWLAKRTGQRRVRMRAQLVAATDVFVWKLLREQGLEGKALQLTLRELCQAIVQE